MSLKTNSVGISEVVWQGGERARNREIKMSFTPVLTGRGRGQGGTGSLPAMATWATAYSHPAVRGVKHGSGGEYRSRDQRSLPAQK